MQVPPLQESPTVQISPSLHVASTGALTQPRPGVQLSAVHVLASSHGSEAPGTQMPPPHASPTVQTSPSSHGPLVLTNAQPVPALQLSMVHGLPSSHGVVAPGRQVPAAHRSGPVQALPSVHVLALGAKTHPVALSQESLVQTSLSSQVMVAPGWHAAFTHRSSAVHASLSVQVPELARLAQPLPGSHVSLVHTLPSLQSPSL